MSGSVVWLAILPHLLGIWEQQTYLSKRGRALRLLLSWEQGCGD